MDILTLKRSHPVQGKPVDVAVEYNGQDVGKLALPLAGWVKLKKLLVKGGELDQREGSLLKFKVRVMGVGVEAPPVLSAKTSFPPAVENQEQDLDAEDVKAIAVAEQQAATAEELVRSLREGEGWQK